MIPVTFHSRQADGEKEVVVALVNRQERPELRGWLLI